MVTTNSTASTVIDLLKNAPTDSPLDVATFTTLSRKLIDEHKPIIQYLIRTRLADVVIDAKLSVPGFAGDVGHLRVTKFYDRGEGDTRKLLLLSTTGDYWLAKIRGGAFIEMVMQRSEWVYDLLARTDDPVNYLLTFYSTLLDGYAGPAQARLVQVQQRLSDVIAARNIYGSRIMTREWFILVLQTKQYEGCRYKVTSEGKERWIPMIDAAQALNSGWRQTVGGGLVMMPSGDVRTLSNEEFRLLFDLTDEWDNNK